jgi:hypothetical protein
VVAFALESAEPDVDVEVDSDAAGLVEDSAAAGLASPPAAVLASDELLSEEPPDLDA